MRNTVLVSIILIMAEIAVFGQEFDITITGAESGTRTHYARNSIFFDYNYSYTPNGGTLTAEIQNPVVTGDISYNTFVNPSTRNLNTSYMVGSTSGVFNVSPVGGATYTIPLDVPPGIGGLQPGLSISYNGMGGVGIVGYGWNISGISAVTRSPKTYHLDGSASGVELSTSDRFSLDGQRLICTSGSYGANGSQYRTENDIFSRVTCYSGTYGPTHFLAETKAGLDCQYGYDADTDQTIVGHNEIVNWYLNKITDVYGNQINYEYIRDNDVVYLAEITYGPNTITFYYQQREDKITNYLKGSKIELRLLLDKIEMKYNSNVIKKI